MRPFRNIFLLIIIVLPAVMSCRAVGSVGKDDMTVAKVGKHRLKMSEIQGFIPEGTTGEDSVRIVMQYANAWASDRVFADIAERQLPKREKDVTKELEEYRMALLRYRYEERYINERLDTALTSDEIEEYYKSRSGDFRASVPLVRARFMRISSDSPNLEPIRRKMSSNREKDRMEADSLAWSSADRYTDYDGNWIDMLELARDFGTDYQRMPQARKNGFITITENGKTNIAYIVDYVGVGEIMPLEYCESGIRDILVGTRKHKLIVTLEQDLLKDARDKGNFIIY